MNLPIDEALPALKAALAEHTRVVLEAPPGAGKTTRVPLALLDAPWLGGRKILMLEPRRLAARAAARFMARALGEEVGETVGYRVRFDARVGPTTRIEVLTEGILTRMLQSDASLENVGLVIFDEFHERHLSTDLGLALALDAQAGLREDLRILVMSATLDGERLGRFLQASRVSSEGRAYEVQIRHEPPKASETIEQTVRRILARDLPALPGDVLIFLPGLNDIKRVLAALKPLVEGQPIDLLALHGELDQDEQERALKPAAPGRRKIIASSNVAESSVTLPGVRSVLDSGLAREMRFDPNRGFAELKTVAITQASATQRAGRAGREGNGVCVRLWDRERRLETHMRPEILHADLAPLKLEVAAWGARIDTLRLLDPPPSGTLAQAGSLLKLLGLLDQDDRLSDAGRSGLRSGAHPRWARALGVAATAAEKRLVIDLLSLLEARDPLLGIDRFEPDLGLRLELLGALNGNQPLLGVNIGALKQIARIGQELARRAQLPAATRTDLNEAGRLALAAFPDRVGRHLGNGRYALSSGALAELPDPSRLRGEPYLVVLALKPRAGALQISLALRVSETDLRAGLAAHLSVHRVSEIDAASGALKVFEEERLLALTLSRRERLDIEPADRLDALKAALRKQGIAALTGSEAISQWRARIGFARFLRPELELPDPNDFEPILDTLLSGKTRLSQITAQDHFDALRQQLSHAASAQLERLFPTHLTVPSGSRKALEYDDNEVRLRVKLQELFGLSETPRINQGQTPVTLHLLSPGQQPIQVTRDLKGFWERTYAEVKRELKGRYPRHPWPDDPLSAMPTARAKPRGT